MRFPIHRWMFFPLLTATLPAAEIRLKGELKLSGQITVMDCYGVTHLQSPISNKLVFIQSAAVKKVLFDEQSRDSLTSRQSIELRMNDDCEGCFADPISPRLTVNRLSLVNRADRESLQQIRGLEVLEWDWQSDQNRGVERGVREYESLIGRRGELHAGRLLGIRAVDSSPVFLCQVNFHKDLLELPEGEISHVFMRNSEGTVLVNAASSFVMQLLGNGSQRIDSCVFEDGKVKAMHPLLGTLQFAQSDLLSLVRSVRHPEKTVQSQ